MIGQGIGNMIKPVHSQADANDNLMVCFPYIAEMMKQHDIFRMDAGRAWYCLACGFESELWCNMKTHIEEKQACEIHLIHRLAK